MGANKTITTDFIEKKQTRRLNLENTRLRESYLHLTNSMSLSGIEADTLFGGMPSSYGVRVESTKRGQ